MKYVELNQTDERLVQIFKALGNPLRMGLVRYMAEHPQCITGDLVLYSNLAQSTVSEHLKVLREVGVVAGTVEGAAVCYCLNTDTMNWLRDQVAILTQELVECCPPTGLEVSIAQAAQVSEGACC